MITQLSLAHLSLSFAISVLIVLLALWRGWLDLPGGLGAIVVGTLILGFGGWMHGALLFTFFFSASLLSRFKRQAKARAAAQFDKGSRRDFWQVLANGGPAALVVVFGSILPGSWWTPLFIGMMSTVTADTWATELGLLSRQPPRLVTTGRVVLAGTSGGISPFGLLVSCLGGMLIGFVAGLWPQLSLWQSIVIGGVSGLFGSLMDSLLGATLQRLYMDPFTQRVTEKAQHEGGTLPQIRGWAWMSNDVVNLLSSTGGGLVAVALAFAFS